MNIIELAKKSGVWDEIGYPKCIERFAALIRADALKDRYFCQRCGKRVGDKNGVWDGVHTCTPPEDVRN